MTPAAIDFEIRTLSLQEDYKEIKLFIKMIDNLLDTCHNFELLQAYLNLFLKIHGDVIVTDGDLAAMVTSLREKEREKWNHLQSMFQNTLCLVKFFSGIQMN